MPKRTRMPSPGTTVLDDFSAEQQALDDAVAAVEAADAELPEHARSKRFELTEEQQRLLAGGLIVLPTGWAHAEPLLLRKLAPPRNPTRGWCGPAHHPQ
jgi:hypothetical protein